MKNWLSLAAFILAAVLSVTALLLPPQGEIDGSVLILIAQILVFCASLLGLENYVNILKKDK